MLTTADVLSTPRIRTHTRPATTDPAPLERCTEDGLLYPAGGCPCWMGLEPSRAASLRRDLDSWFASFKARHPEFALG